MLQIGVVVLLRHVSKAVWNVQANSDGPAMALWAPLRVLKSVPGMAEGHGADGISMPCPCRLMRDHFLASPTVGYQFTGANKAPVNICRAYLLSACGFRH